MKKALRHLIFAAVLCAMTLCPFALAQDAQTGTVTAEGVNIRMLPDKEAQVLAQVSLGTELSVISNEGGWYRVLYNDEVGYISKDYLFVNATGSRGAYVQTDGATLRGGPGQDAYAITTLSAGQGVKVKAIIKEWYFAVVNDQAGYIHRTYLTMSESSTAGGSMLKMGMEGAEVKKLQGELYDRGFLNKDSITGSYGAKTRTAVLEYQKAMGFSSADGVAGTQTLSTLYDKNNRLKKETANLTKLKGTVILLDWFKGGSDWLHKGARFTVTDVKTGLSFRARRFGGWYHADVEPITAGDTAIMKRIAGGKWSWDRRAIWVTYAGKTVAASMHCMPHMSNPTRSNNFDGHFCIHLLNSKVHETSKPCPRHQACVRAAYKAGK